MGAPVVTGLHTPGSRQHSPWWPEVFTLGSIHGGPVLNVIAGEVVIEGTLRTFDAQLRDRLLQRMAELGDGIARAMRGACEFQLRSASPPVVNDASIASLVAGTAGALPGCGAVGPIGAA